MYFESEHVFLRDFQAMAGMARVYFSSSDSWFSGKRGPGIILQAAVDPSSPPPPRMIAPTTPAPPSYKRPSTAFLRDAVDD